MKSIVVKSILELIDGKLICGDENEVLQNFKKDTNEIKNGDTYVGLKGENVDGSIFYDKAFENGARACIISETVKISEEDLKKYSRKSNYTSRKYFKCFKRNCNL